MKSNIVWLLVIVIGAWLGIEFAANSLGTWVYYGAGIIIVGMLAWTQWQMKHQKNIIFLLSNQCDPEAFLTAYEAEMSQVKDPLQLDMLRINQAAGVCYAGEFDMALKILRSIRLEELKGIYKAHYYNNLVSVLILAGRDKEAQRMYDRGKEYLEMPLRNNELEIALQGTQGGIAFLQGNLETARQKFEDLLVKSPAPLIDATSHLFMGRIETAEGRREMGAEHFQKAVALGGKTVIAQLARTALEA